MQASINSNALDNAVKLACLLVDQHRNSSNEAQRNWCKSTLAHACRHLEYFLTPYVSEAAHAEAIKLVIAPLEQYGWQDQKRRMRDPSRKIFHFEHVVPVSDLVKELLGASPLTEESARRILGKAAVAWITKDEDGRLTRARFRTNRTFGGFHAYKAVGIRLLKRPNIRK